MIAGYSVIGKRIGDQFTQADHFEIGFILVEAILEDGAAVGAGNHDRLDSADLADLVELA